MAGCPAAGQNCYEGLMPFCICRQQKNKTWCSLAPSEGFVGCAVLSPPGMSTSEIQGDSKPQGRLLGFIFRYLQHSPWIIPHWPSLPWLPFHSPMALIKAFESKKGMLSCYPKGLMDHPSYGLPFLDAGSPLAEAHCHVWWEKKTTGQFASQDLYLSNSLVNR